MVKLKANVLVLTAGRLCAELESSQVLWRLVPSGPAAKLLVKAPTDVLIMSAGRLMCGSSQD